MAADKLDRLGVSQAVAEMLQADTTVLYGSGKLLQVIDYGIENFEKTKVNTQRPFGMYLAAEIEDSQEIRSQNEYINYLINIRFAAHQRSLQNAYSAIDNAYERVKYLVNDQMWTGQMMSLYNNDTNAQIFNIEPTGSDLDTPEETEGNLLRVNIDGAILVEVAKWK